MDVAARGDAPGNVVWHYTDLTGLLGVLSTNTLWASSSSLLNDTQEMKHGREKVRFAFDKASSAMTSGQLAFVENKLAVAEKEILGGLTFVLCASTNGDSLSQWRGYSRNSGYAIGIRTPDRIDLLEVPGARDGLPGESQFVSPWRKVRYGSGQKEVLAREFIDRLTALADPSVVGDFWNDALVTAYAPSAYGAAISRMKHDGFEDEREVRIVATAGAAERFYHFRAGPYGPTPFVKLTGVPKAKSVSGRVTYAQPGAGLLPIQAIRIGPTPHRETAEEGLRSALVRYGYEGVEIKHSDLPFR